MAKPIEQMIGNPGTTWEYTTSCSHQRNSSSSSQSPPWLSRHISNRSGIICRASNMILSAHLDAGFNNKNKIHMSWWSSHLSLRICTKPTMESPVLAIVQITPFIMVSAAEVALGALYITTKALVSMRRTLVEMGWQQPLTPVQWDNTTAVRVTNKTILPQKLKAMDNCYHWLRCTSSNTNNNFTVLMVL